MSMDYSPTELTARVKRELTDAVLEITEKMDIANAGNDRILRRAQDAAIHLWNIGIKTPDDIHKAFSWWKKNDDAASWRHTISNDYLEEIAAKWIKRHKKATSKSIKIPNFSEIDWAQETAI